MFNTSIYFISLLCFVFLCAVPYFIVCVDVPQFSAFLFASISDCCDFVMQYLCDALSVQTLYLTCPVWFYVFYKKNFQSFSACCFVVFTFSVVV